MGDRLASVFWFVFLEDGARRPVLFYGGNNMSVRMSDREYAEALLSKIRQAQTLLEDLADSKMVEVANRELGIGELALDLEGLATELSALAGQFKELYLPE